MTKVRAVKTGKELIKKLDELIASDEPLGNVLIHFYSYLECKVVVDRKWLEELFDEVNENHHPVGTKSWLFHWQETRQRLLGREAEEK